MTKIYASFVFIFITIITVISGAISLDTFYICMCILLLLASFGFDDLVKNRKKIG